MNERMRGRRANFFFSGVSLLLYRSHTFLWLEFDSMGRIGGAALPVSCTAGFSGARAANLKLKHKCKHPSVNTSFTGRQTPLLCHCFRKTQHTFVLNRTLFSGITLIAENEKVHIFKLGRYLSSPY